MDIRKRRYALVIDSRKCINCKACVVACKAENGVPIGNFRNWINSDRQGEYPKLRIDFEPEQCHHCEHPSCVRVCPTGASWQRKDGVVLVYADDCIGCRYCMVACPYDNRVFNWRTPVQEPPADVAVVGETPARSKGVVEKCTFCVQRTTEGLLPRCVVACPTGARVFGDLNDPESEVSVLLRERPSYVVFPERGTEPSLHYLIRTGPNSVGGDL
jgi:Fe-S-cluster-containing dehydrogenase component